jgi:serine/threonine protein kinase/Tol biopolymer transport system component
MAIGPGSRLGPYEVTALLGEGGMGKVWRAHHTGLKRDDALKVLPDAFASDPERLARFRREAQVLASLNHPNIAHVYGLEQADGVQALVMELVEGPTLADRIAQGRIPVDEALPIAKQIAEALEAAHEQGIIHRDLKPANVKVRPDGTVKVLDFGLAKAMEPTGAMSPSVSQSPTITSPAMMTGVGVLLGTAAYMSPEQARGKAVDKRSDIWAFGAVLYEMLTGKRTFDGEDVTDTLAAVVRSEPKWDALPDTLSPGLRVFLRRCLEKNPKQRVADIRDVRLALEGAFEPDVSKGVQSPQAAVQPVWRRVLPIAIAATVVVLITGVAAWSLWPTPVSRPISRFDYTLPEGQQFRNTSRLVVAFSPDSRHFVYNATGGLYLRAIDELQARLIPGTEIGLTNPFFSPDGESIAYEQSGELKRVSISGGVPIVICKTTTALFGATWGPDNMILFGQPAGIMRVPAIGGTPELVIKANDGEQLDGPQLLADGESVLFTVTTAKGATRWDQAQIVVQSLRTGERKVVLKGGSGARYLSTGHLVYAVGDTLFAVAFDAGRLEVNRGAVSVVEGIMRGITQAASSPSVNYGISNDGTLVYATGGASVSFGTLVWVDRNGTAKSLSERQAGYRTPRVSPDGARVAVAVQNVDDNEDIWMVDVERGTHTRFTSDIATDTNPLWTPDGTRLVFSSGQAGGASALYWMPADGSGQSEELTKAATNQGATSWLPDGTTLAFYDVGGSYDIFTVKAGESPVRFSETPFREQGPAFSPDGRWLAYSSDETGQAEIYVTPYPGPGGRTAISTGGGRSPRWSSNGRELFYRKGRQMMVVSVEPGPTIRVGTPRLLFEGDFVPELDNTGAHNYDVSRDGQRFLMIAPVARPLTGAARPKVVIVENWFEELKRLVPAN